MKEYSLECPDCGIPWAASSDREMVLATGVEECRLCGADLELVVEEF